MVTSSKAKGMLSLHGDVKSQLPSAWRGKFPLPKPLERFYRYVGPVDVEIDDYGNPYFLPRLADLWQFQAGYRWNANTKKANADWNDDWIVVAYQGGDPLIFSRTSGRILHAVHGCGAWEASEIFPDLNVMAAGLSALGSIVLEAGDSLTDDDFCILKKWRVKAAKDLRDLLGSPRAARVVVDKLGWGA